MLSGLATSAKANDLELRGDPVAALQGYVQLVAVAQPGTAAPAAETSQAPARVAGSNIDGDAYAALRVFAQRIGDGSPQPSKDRLKVADADSLFEFLQQQNGGAPAEQPTAPAPKPARPRPSAPAVPATVVGSKVCLGCHASQADAFGYTLMGRLHKQGKMECETCHGPGSAHVKAGGGVGVGGIISFRPDDDSRTAGTEQRHLPRLP